MPATLKRIKELREELVHAGWLRAEGLLFEIRGLEIKLMQEISTPSGR